MTNHTAVRTGPPVRTAVLSAGTSAPLRIAVLAVGASVAVAVADPEHTHVPLCPLHAMTGLQCPFCGTLRAIGALARGRFVAALQDNLLFVTAVPVVFALWLDWFLRARTGRASRAFPRWAAVAVVALVVAFAVVRNLPVAGALRP